MRAARIGWFLVLLAVIGGYAFGRYRKAASERRVEAGRILPTSGSGIPSPDGSVTLPRRVNARSRVVKISTDSTQELDLPSDFRYTNSLPRKFE